MQLWVKKPPVPLAVPDQRDQCSPTTVAAPSLTIGLKYDGLTKLDSEPPRRCGTLLADAPGAAGVIAAAAIPTVSSGPAAMAVKCLIALAPSSSAVRLLRFLASLVDPAPRAKLDCRCRTERPNAHSGEVSGLSNGDCRSAMNRPGESGDSVCCQLASARSLL